MRDRAHTVKVTLFLVLTGFIAIAFPLIDAAMTWLKSLIPH